MSAIDIREVEQLVKPISLSFLFLSLGSFVEKSQVVSLQAHLVEGRFSGSKKLQRLRSKSSFQSIKPLRTRKSDVRCYSKRLRPVCPTSRCRQAGTPLPHRCPRDCKANA